MPEQWVRYGRAAGVALAAWLLVVCATNAVLLTVTIAGETAMLANPPIEYATTGRWIYPVHAQHLFYPGVDRFMIHPPLHYGLASLFLKAFGVGVWQIHLTSALTATAALLAAAALAWRFFGWGHAVAVLAMAAGLEGFYKSSLQLRTDATFGLAYGVMVATFGWALLGRHAQRRLLALSFAMGVLAVLTLAVHWYGYFVQLYLPAWLALAWLMKRPSWRDLIAIGAAMTAGWALAMGVWWLAWGQDLPRSLVFVLIKGQQFLDILDMPMSGYFHYLTEWRGGRPVLAGLLLGIGALGVASARAISERRPLGQRERVAAFLIANLCAYWLFFLTFVANKDPQYGANLYPILLPFAAFGWGAALSVAAGALRLQRDDWRQGALAGIGVLAAVTSPMTAAYASAAPKFASARPNAAYDGLRDALTAVVPAEFSTVVGGNAYPYLYDRAYRSTFLLMGERFLTGRPRSDSLPDLVHFYRNMPGQDYRTATFPSDARAAAIGRSSAMVTSDLSHSYQWYFYDFATWRGTFREVATAFVLTPRSPLVEERGSFFTVALRDDAVAAAVARNPKLLDGPPRVWRSGDVLLFTFDAVRNRRPQTTDEEFQLLDEGDRMKQLADYFDAMDWFGAAMTAAEKQATLAAIFPAFQNQMLRYVGIDYHGVAITRSIGQSVDYVFAEEGVPEVFSRAAQPLPR